MARQTLHYSIFYICNVKIVICIEFITFHLYCINNLVLFQCQQGIQLVWRDFFFTFLIQPQKMTDIFVFTRYKLLIELHRRTKGLIALSMDVTSFTTTNGKRTLLIRIIIQNLHTMNYASWRSMVSFQKRLY